MFSALQARRDLSGARVLDLYAGSGALGFEALSRGAGTLLAIDADRVACAALQHNRTVISAALRHEATITVVCQPVARALAHLTAGQQFDLVFSDPPYELAHEDVLGDLEALRGHLADGALVVVERSAKSPENHWPEGFEVVANKTYGDTRVVTLSR